MLSENVFNGDGTCFFGRELACPVHPPGVCRAFALIAIFGISGGLLVVGLVPVVPALGSDVLAQSAIYK